MDGEGKESFMGFYWSDFPGSANADKDPASLLRPFSEAELETALRPLGPNVANSTMFIMLSEDCSDPHFIKDSSFNYIYANKAMANLLKRPAKEIIGLKDEQLFSSGEVGSMVCATSRSLRGRIVREKNIRTIDGIPRTFVDTLVPWRNDSGEIVAIYGTSVDITDKSEPPLIFDIGDGESRSEVMRGTLALAQVAATVDSVVLLTGESGVGKDYLARYIHDHSDLSKGPYRSINCGALPENLVESELFGHEKGAFSGADRRKRGLVELADQGTLFLNEIAELSIGLQAKLLTFVEEKRFNRIGGEKDLTVDVRIITATNRDLELEIKEGNFRFDLYQRLNVLAIRIPPLRKRMEDIPILTKALVDKIAPRLKIETPIIVLPSFIEALAKYHWPGNVRELGNVIERALILFKTKGAPLDSRLLRLPVAEGLSVGLDPNRDSIPDGAGTARPMERGPVKRPEKPGDDELLGLFEDYIIGQGWTRARLAREVLRVDESTAKKWLKAAGAPEGKKGRRPKAAASIKKETD